MRFPRLASVSVLRPYRRHLDDPGPWHIRTMLPTEAIAPGRQREEVRGVLGRGRGFRVRRRVDCDDLGEREERGPPCCGSGS